MNELIALALIICFTGLLTLWTHTVGSACRLGSALRNERLLHRRDGVKLGDGDTDYPAPTRKHWFQRKAR